MTGQGLIQRGQLVAYDRIDRPLGTGQLVDLPQMTVHPGEIGRNTASDSLGEGFRLIYRQRGQRTADGQYAEECAADHVVRVSRVRGLTGLVPDGVPGCSS